MAGHIYTSGLPQPEDSALSEVEWPLPWEGPDHEGDYRLVLWYGPRDMGHRAGIAIVWKLIEDAPPVRAGFYANVYPHWPHGPHERVDFDTLLEVKCWLIAKGYLDPAPETP